MKLTKHQRLILAYTVLGEAGGDKKSQQAVAWVIRNRAASGRFPSDPAAVALQKNQFSTWNKGSGGNDPIGTYGSKSHAVNAALQEVDKVFGGEVSDPTGGAIGYYANKGPNAIAKPNWFDKVAKGGGTQIGDQLFSSVHVVALNKNESGGPDDRHLLVPLPRPRPDPHAGMRVAEVTPRGIVKGLQDGVEAAGGVVPAGGLVSHTVHTVPIDDQGNPVIQPALNVTVHGTAAPHDFRTPQEELAAVKAWTRYQQEIDAQSTTANVMGSHAPPQYQQKPAQPDRSIFDTTDLMTEPLSYDQLVKQFDVHSEARGSTVGGKDTSQLDNATPPSEQRGLPAFDYANAQPKYTTVFKTVDVNNPAYDQYLKDHKADSIYDPNDVIGQGTGNFSDLGKLGDLKGPIIPGTAPPPSVPVAPPPKTIQVRTPTRVLVRHPASAPSHPVPVSVQIATGKHAIVGSVSTSQDGKYSYKVQSDGSILNTTTGRISAPSPQQHNQNRGSGISGSTTGFKNGSWQYAS